MMNSNRPVVISIVQYLDELEAGTFTIFDLLDKVKQSGVRGVELRREVWANYQTELAAVRERLQADGKFATYATFSTLFSPTAEAQALLLHDLDTAKALGSPLLRIFPGDAPVDVTHPAWAKAREAVDYAEALGIVIALENWAKLPGGRLSEVKHVLDNISSPALKVNVDIANYAMHGDDVLEAIRVTGERVVYAHLKDKAGTESDATTHLGGGILPMREIVGALNALPQEVIYCFEFVGDGEADMRIEKSLAYLRDFESTV